VIGYLVSGLLAVGAAAIISFIFKAMLSLSFETSFYNSLVTFPWFGLSFVAAATIAALLDDFAKHPERVPKGFRYLEGAIAGTTLAIAAWYVCLALAQVRDYVTLISKQVQAHEWARLAI